MLSIPKHWLEYGEFLSSATGGWTMLDIPTLGWLLEPWPKLWLNNAVWASRLGSCWMGPTFSAHRESQSHLWNQSPAGFYCWTSLVLRFSISPCPILFWRTDPLGLLGDITSPKPSLLVGIQNHINSLLTEISCKFNPNSLSYFSADSGPLNQQKTTSARMDSARSPCAGGTKARFLLCGMACDWKR